MSTSSPEPLLPRLTSAQYAEFFALFLERSSDPPRMTAITSRRLSALQPAPERGRAPLRVFSAGPGSARWDMEVLAAVGRPVELYVSVEPSAEMVRAQGETLSKAKASGLIEEYTIVHEDVEAYLSRPPVEPRQGFDVALFSHCLYYVQDRRSVLRSIRTRLDPGGLAVVLLASGRIRDLACRYNPGSTHELDANEFEAELREAGVPFEREETGAKADVTDVERDAAVARGLVSFFADGDAAALSEDLLSEAARDIARMSRREAGRLLMDCGTGVFIIPAA